MDIQSRLQEVKAGPPDAGPVMGGYAEYEPAITHTELEAMAQAALSRGREGGARAERRGIEQELAGTRSRAVDDTMIVVAEWIEPLIRRVLEDPLVYGQNLAAVADLEAAREALQLFRETQAGALDNLVGQVGRPRVG